MKNSKGEQGEVPKGETFIKRRWGEEGVQGMTVGFENVGVTGGGRGQ